MTKTTKATHATDPNPKTAQAEESLQTAQPAGAGAVAAAPGAGPAVADAAQGQAQRDKNHGRGGKYRLVNGVRTLVERTEESAPGEAATDTKGATA